MPAGEGPGRGEPPRGVAAGGRRLLYYISLKQILPVMSNKKRRETFGRILENGVAMGPASRFALQVWYHHDVGSQEAASQ